MLAWLSIQGLALVESLELRFGPGLNVLTGETGAGKSIIVGSIGLLLGERADADWLRAGVERGFVEGAFDLTERPDLVEAVRALDVEPEEGRVIVRRELQADGRSRALVNGRTVLLGPLRALGDVLVDLHGQHEHQQLLKPDRQEDFFDLWAGTAEERRDLDRERAALAEARRALVEARTRWASDRENEARLREDYEELCRAALREDEGEQLKRDRDRLRHRERLLTALAEAASMLLDDDRGVTALAKRSARALQQAAVVDAGMAALAEESQTLLEQAAILGDRIDVERARLADSPLDVDAIEARLDLIHRLKRKHGTDEAGLLALTASLEERIQALEPRGDALDAEERELARRVAAYRKRLGTLLDRRGAAGASFRKEVGARLSKLGFGKASISVLMEDRDMVRRSASARDPGEATALVDPPPIPGLHFAFEPNPGEMLRSMQRIASGGELSRVMLALKSLMAERDRVSVLVFDEVDQGIGGAVAEEVGILLRALGTKRQVLCITHLPMIAAFGADHFEVVKGTGKGRTTTTVRPLQGPAREREVARLLAGARASQTTLRQARELLRAAREAGATGARRTPRASRAS